MNTVAFVRNQNIDKRRWNQVLDSSPDATVYAYSWYLDVLCPDWSALIGGDYEFIMPIPWRKKFGLRYVYMPYFLQRLGIYSSQAIEKEIQIAFLEKLKHNFPLIDYSLTVSPALLEKLQLKVLQRNNFVLDISSSYEKVYAGYSRDAQKNLRKKGLFSVSIDNDYQSILKNYLEYLSSRMKSHVDFFDQSKSYQLLISQAIREDKIIGLSVYKENQLWGSALFLRNRDTAFYLMGVPVFKENRNNTLHLLIDGFIQEYAGKLKTLDFEGSDIHSIAYFFEKWGSRNEPYFRIFYVKNSVIAGLLKLREFFYTR